MAGNGHDLAALFSRAAISMSEQEHQLFERTTRITEWSVSDWLLVQMKHEPRTAVDEAWIAEAEKRFDAWKRKATKTVSAGRALREIRKELHH